MWGGIFGAIGQSAGSITSTIFGTGGAGIAEAAGWADKQRAAQYANAELQAKSQQDILSAKTKQFQYILIAIVVVFFIILLMRR